MGDIAIYMLGATKEQCDAVHRWLVAQFNPKLHPGDALLPKRLEGGRAHGSQLSPLGS